MSLGKNRLGLLACLGITAFVAGSCGCDNKNVAMGSCYDVTATNQISTSISEEKCTSTCPPDHECVWSESTQGGGTGSVGPI
ncbi:MAG: hypothetical protein ABI679_03980 [Gemmatimonadota bacterium]